MTPGTETPTAEQYAEQLFQSAADRGLRLLALYRLQH
jgi:hypothetical protein